jgi:hypothetical protein
MKILINNKYQEVDFWSFMKCSFLTQLALLGIIYGSIILVIILGAIVGLAVG